MPYRRLPNTDQARLRSLRKAVTKANQQDYSNNAIGFKQIREAELFLMQFEKQLEQYNQCLSNQVNANKQYQQILQNARMYISHFIQVFNLAVIRGEIRKEHKLLYQLDPEVHNVPDLAGEAALHQWGQNIIDGENERVRNGGTPIYTPTIAKVQVHYEVFREYKSTQKLYQATTNRNWEEVVKLREQGDAILLEIWNQVEAYFKDEEPAERIRKCEEYGLIYYYRKNEKRPE